VVWPVGQINGFWDFCSDTSGRLGRGAAIRRNAIHGFEGPNSLGNGYHERKELYDQSDDINKHVPATFDEGYQSLQISK
jgi:hypothetical protein